MLLFKLAVRNVRRQRRRSVLTCLSIAGGYVMCVLSFSLVEGSYGNVITIFTEDETGHVQLHRGDYLDKPRLYTTIDNPGEVDAVLTATSEIRSSTPRVFAAALAYTDSGHAPVRVIGIHPEREAGTSRLKRKVTSGSWLTAPANPETETAQVMVGASVATSLEIGTGDEIILISEGADGSVANDLFRVSAIVGDRSSPERQNVYLPLGAAQTFLSLQGSVHEYAILLNEIDKAREVAGMLDAKLTGITASPWQVAREAFYKSMEADKKGNRFTLAIVLFIVFIGVLNTVLMSVLERTREFGVMKAIGSRPSFIAALIMIETSLLAAASLVLGIIVALPVIAWFTFVGIEMPEPVDIGGAQFSYLTGAMTPGVILQPVLIIFVYTFAVSLLPGIRAARILPTTAMRDF